MRDGFQFDDNGFLVRVEGPCEWDIDITTAEGRVEAWLRFENGIVGYRPVYQDISSLKRDLRSLMNTVKSREADLRELWSWRDYQTDRAERDANIVRSLGAMCNDKSDNQVIKVGVLRELLRNKDWDAEEA